VSRLFKSLTVAAFLMSAAALRKATMAKRQTQDTLELVGKLNQATNEVAGRLTTVQDQLKQLVDDDKLEDADVEQINKGLQGAIDRLTTLAANPADPVPPGPVEPIPTTTPTTTEPGATTPDDTSDDDDDDEDTAPANP
jgi:TolA-binding protein